MLCLKNNLNAEVISQERIYLLKDEWNMFIACTVSQSYSSLTWMPSHSQIELSYKQLM